MKYAAQRRKSLSLTAFTLILLATVAVAQDSYSDSKSIKADLVSFNQVPSVLAGSHGKFTAEINDDGALTYSLSYSNMTSPVVQAHIHFGDSRTNGGVMVFLCGGAKPACPASGTITGTLTAADVSVLPVTNGDSVIPQGIQPGNFQGMVKAIETGHSYVNVHTANFPSGEIRGQVKMDE